MALLCLENAPLLFLSVEEIIQVVIQKPTCILLDGPWFISIFYDPDSYLNISFSVDFKIWVFIFKRTRSCTWRRGLENMVWQHGNDYCLCHFSSFLKLDAFKQSRNNQMPPLSPKCLSVSVVWFLVVLRFLHCRMQIRWDIQRSLATVFLWWRNRSLLCTLLNGCLV